MSNYSYVSSPASEFRYLQTPVMATLVQPLYFPITASSALISRPFSSLKSTQPNLSSTPFFFSQSIPIALKIPSLLNPIGTHRLKHFFIRNYDLLNSTAISSFKGACLTIGLIVSTQVIGGLAASAVEIPFLNDSSFQFNEPRNALSLPTWAIHVSSVVEWITAMFLVWQYGEKSGYESWKGLSWGMVPLLGGAFCACTWHFFYNAESLSALVALQAALTVIGNFTMCIAAFRIYRSSQGGKENW